jgi:O-antigen/teichoic acid export membrane protein
VSREEAESRAGAGAELPALFGSAALVFVGTLVGSGATLVERVVIGRALSVDAYGRVSVGLALLTLGSTVALVGLAQGVPRYMSRFDRPARLRGTWLVGLAAALGGGTVVGGALYLAAAPLADALLDGRDAALLRVFALAVPAVATLQTGVAGIRGMENTRYRTLSRDLCYPVVRIGALVALLAAGANALAAGYAYLLGAVVAAVVAHRLLARLLPLVGPVETDVPALVRFSLPLVVSSVLSMLLLQTDTVVLGYFRPSADVALYGAAYPLAYAIVLVLSAFGFVYLPMASRLDADGDHAALATVYATISKWVFVFTFPAFLAFVAFPADVLTVVFGARYAGGAPALAVLALGFTLNSLAGRNRQTMSALGHTAPLVPMTAGAFCLNLAANVALVPRYGPVGAAVASAGAYTALNLVVCGYLRARFGIDPFSRATLRTVVALPAVTVPAAFALSGHVSLTAATLPVFLVGAGGCSLAVVALAGGLAPADAALLDAVEERAGVTVPAVRRFVPDDEGTR